MQHLHAGCITTTENFSYYVQNTEYKPLVQCTINLCFYRFECSLLECSVFWVYPYSVSNSIVHQGQIAGLLLGVNKLVQIFLSNEE